MDAKRVSVNTGEGDAVGGEMVSVVMTDAGISGAEAGTEAGTGAGTEAGTEAGTSAGAEAGMSAGVEPPPISLDPEIFEVEVDPVISGLVILEAWPLGERWILLSERGLVSWSPSLEPEPAPIGAPATLTIHEGELTPIRLEGTPDYPAPSGAPLTSMVIAGRDAILFPSGLWVSPHIQESAEGATSSIDADLSWERSPLSDLFDTVSGATWFEGALWLSDDVGVGRWRSADESWMRYDTLDELAHAQLSVGAWRGRDAALWARLLVSGQAFAIAEGSKWSHETWWSDLPLAHTAETVWGVREGALVGGVSGEPWRAPALDALGISNVTALWSGGEALWTLARGRLWRWSDDGVRRLVDTRDLLDVSALSAEIGYAPLDGRWWGGRAVDANTLYLWGRDGLTRASVERAAAWFAESDILNAASVSFALRGVDYERASRVSAWLSATPPDASSEVELPNDVWDLTDTTSDQVRAVGELSLNRASIPDALREQAQLWLIAYVERDERGPQVTSIALNVTPEVTWVDEIEPLFTRSCVACHDNRGGARILSAPEQWIEAIDDIILVVESQSMPIGLPPLMSEEVELIRRWRDDGFPR